MSAANRRQIIDESITQLKEFAHDDAYKQYRYAIVENILFLEAAKHIGTYIRWLLTRLKHIQRDDIIELTDLPVPLWDKEMHTYLMALQRNTHIGLGLPLVERVISLIEKKQGTSVILDIGAGGMELDKQICTKLLGKKHLYPVILVGIDASETVRKLANTTMQSVQDVTVHSFERFTKYDLDTIKKDAQGIHVVICGNNIFRLAEEFPKGEIDIIYHSLFKHHISDQKHSQLDTLFRECANTVLEYDGYRFVPSLIPQSVTGWKYPILLSDAVFSWVRYKDKRTLESAPGLTKFYKSTGHYLREF